MDEKRLDYLKSIIDEDYTDRHDMPQIYFAITDLRYLMDRAEESNLITDKLADIRDLFDESDMAAEGHGMEDAVGQPYVVACYAENKMKRLIEENYNLQEEVLLLYGRLNMISDIIEKGRLEVKFK